MPNLADIEFEDHKLTMGEYNNMMKYQKTQDFDALMRFMASRATVALSVLEAYDLDQLTDLLNACTDKLSTAFKLENLPNGFDDINTDGV